MPSAGRYTLAVLLGLLLGKILATSLTIAIGGSGGVFAPSLFLGAMLGAAYAAVIGDVAGAVSQPAAFAVVGMAAVFAGPRAPATATVIVFELTGQYGIVLPLMLAVAAATLVSRLVSHDTIYTRKLLRRGVDLAALPASSPLAGLRAGDVMRPPPAPLAHDATVADAARRVAIDRDSVPYADLDGRIIGLVTPSGLEQAFTDDVTVVSAIVERLATVAQDAGVAPLVHQLAHRDAAVGVVDADLHVVGWIAGHDVLAAYAVRSTLPPPAAGPSEQETPLRAPAASPSTAGSHSSPTALDNVGVDPMSDP